MCKPSSYLSTHGEPYPNNYWSEEVRN
jgi:hypothetical protein